jgi:hypothetical protein
MNALIRPVPRIRKKDILALIGISLRTRSEIHAGNCGCERRTPGQEKAHTHG